MKRITLFAFFCIASISVYAQSNVVATSTPFNNDKGLVRILPMKNGNTIVLRLVKDKYSFTVYDPQHKLKGSHDIQPRLAELDNGGTHAIFEANGDIVLMRELTTDKVPALYRQVVDANTGQVKSEEKLAELEREGRFNKVAENFGVPDPEFFVRYDAESESYGLAILNSFTPDRSKRLEMVLYDSHHTQVNRTFVVSPGEKYKYTNFVAMTIIGKDQLCLLSSVYNTRSKGGTERELLLTSLTGSAQSAMYSFPAYKNEEIGKAILKYNPVAKKLIQLIDVYTRGYTIRMSVIDPVSGKMDQDTSIYPEKAKVKNQELFGKKTALSICPQDLIINKDGSFSVLFEDVKYYTNREPGQTTTAYSELGRLAVATYDAQGKELQNFLLPKKHYYLQYILGPFYHRNGNGLANLWEDWGNHYKCYVYVNTDKGNYMLMNDLGENEARIKDGRISEVKKAGDVDAFSFELNPGQVLPERKFLFGEPGKGGHKVAILDATVYHRITGEVVTLLQTKEGRSDDICVAWIKL